MAITPVCEIMYKSLGSDHEYKRQNSTKTTRQQKRLVFFISFASFQTANPVFYALDKETQRIYLVEPSDRALQQNGVD